MAYKRYCIFDTETTNVYGNSAAPIQIAAEITDSKGNVLDTFNEKINTNHSISPDATKVHHITKADLRGCRKEREVLEDFCAWIKTSGAEVFLTYNGQTFDRPMLNERCKVLDIPFDWFDINKFPGIDGYYDCVLLAKKENMFGLKDQLGRRWKLTLVAECLGIDTELAHDALGDVDMLRQIFFKLDPILHPDTVKRSLLS